MISPLVQLLQTNFPLRNISEISDKFPSSFLVDSQNREISCIYF